VATLRFDPYVAEMLIWCVRSRWRHRTRTKLLPAKLLQSWFSVSLLYTLAGYFFQRSALDS